MNNRRWVLLVVGLLITAFRVSAQPSTSPLEWNSRRLTLEDYIVSEVYSGKLSNSSFQWSESTSSFRPLERRWLKIKYTDIRNSFIPSDSWIRGDARTAQKLNYEQLKFDLSEYYCRKVEREVNFHGKLESAMAMYCDSLSIAVRRFSGMTNDGENHRVVDSLMTVVSHQLSGSEMPYQDVLFPEKEKFFFALSWYEEYLFLHGDIARLLPSPSSFIVLEATAGFGRMGLTAGFAFRHTTGGQKSKESFTYKSRLYPAGAKYEDCRYYGLLEYNVIDNPRFQLRPFIGAGIYDMSFFPEENLQSFSSPLFLAGISADFCLSSIWNLSKRMLTDLQVRARLYITRERIADYSGCGIYMGIGFTPKFCKTL